MLRKLLNWYKAHLQTFPPPSRVAPLPLPPSPPPAAPAKPVGPTRKGRKHQEALARHQQEVTERISKSITKRDAIARKIKEERSNKYKWGWY